MWPRHRSAQDADGPHGPDVQAPVGVPTVTAEDEVGAVADGAVDGLGHVVDVVLAGEAERPGHGIVLGVDAPDEP